MLSCWAKNWFVHEDDKLIFSIFSSSLWRYMNFNSVVLHPLFLFCLIVLYLFCSLWKSREVQVDKIITPNPPVQVIDQCYDQGYGSERSPEDEMPPPLPMLGIEQQFNPMIVNSVMMPQGYEDGSRQMFEIDAQQRLHQQAILQKLRFYHRR